jgi:mRNA interferase RelE/StbE
VLDAVLAFMTGPLLDNPKRLGKPLAGELTGLWSARRGDYRVVDEINDEVVTVTVVRVGPRRNVHRLSC